MWNCHSNCCMFESYSDYLKSEHWVSLRREVQKHWGGRCAMCYKKGFLHVHHRTYERAGHEHPTDLVGLCSTCHSLFHTKTPTFSSSSRKRIDLSTKSSRHTLVKQEERERLLEFLETGRSSEEVKDFLGIHLSAGMGRVIQLLNELRKEGKIQCRRNKWYLR